MDVQLVCSMFQFYLRRQSKRRKLERWWCWGVPGIWRDRLGAIHVSVRRVQELILYYVPGSNWAVKSKHAAAFADCAVLLNVNWDCSAGEYISTVSPLHVAVSSTQSDAVMHRMIMSTLVLVFDWVLCVYICANVFMCFYRLQWNIQTIWFSVLKCVMVCVT